MEKIHSFVFCDEGKRLGLKIETLLYCIQARKCSNPMRSCPTPNSEMTLWSHHWFGRLLACNVPSIFMALWNSDRTMWVPDSFEYSVHKNLDTQKQTITRKLIRYLTKSTSATTLFFLFSCNVKKKETTNLKESCYLILSLKIV